MAQIPYFTDDIAYHTKLGDNPNTDNGLSADELKAVYDAAALAIQKFINDYIVPALNEEVGSDAFLKVAGGTMKGILSMGGNRISGLGSPVADGDAITKAFLNSYLVGVAQGGTGARDAESARVNLGAAATKHVHTSEDINGSIPMDKGGTGAQEASEGLKNLLEAGYMRLSSYQIVASVEDIPEDAPEGAVFFIPEE